ncbi:expressed unknown protein [Seminavis robusta]|uniref:Uncharacterized protein n=1 Tax=Seminavis robusta TaxID=568900 RepID=A0A9N8DG57_9STRA|nr:expressed unknown protein [Seminavis robusta]|eukprot:Sro52_g031020.1 n/a (723) ;mRNA; r:75080-77332
MTVRRRRCLVLPRRNQFLVVAAVYVFFSLGILHENTFNFSGVSRWMQVAEEDAHNYEHWSPEEKQKLRRQEDGSWIKETRDDLKHTALLPHIDAVAKETTGQVISTAQRYYDSAVTAADRIVQKNIKNVAKIRRQWRINWERNRDENLKKLQKWDDNPVFVLSLPGTSTLATSRYFKCGLGSGGTNDFAFYWTSNGNESSEQIEIGRCMQDNLDAGRPPLDGCGTAKVWSSMGFVAPKEEKCFFPSIDRRAMDALAEAYPEATILQVTQDPEEWYRSSYRRFRSNLVSFCNRDDGAVPIPENKGASKAEWVAFYEWNLQSVRDFAAAHPSIHYVEVALEDSETNAILQKELGLPRLCWQSVGSGRKHAATEETKITEPPRALLQSTSPSKKTPPLQFPIFVASLPKSGTTSTQRFFQCGLSYNQAGHHWTRNITTDEPLRIGKCMEYNLQRNRSIFEECGDFRVWTDLGYFDEPHNARERRKRKRQQQELSETALEASKHAQEQPPGCYFPTMHGGLEHFYQSHPNGTILNVVRDADAWYDSAMNWRKLPERMSRGCKGFPPPGSSPEVWRQFYISHTVQVRMFAEAHPSLSYLEVSLESPDTGRILQEHTGIPDFCWGNCNPDPSNGMCGVLEKMRRFKAQKRYEEKQKNQKNAREAVRNRRKQQQQQLLPWQPRKSKNQSTTPRKKTIEADGVRTDDEWKAILKAFDLLKGTPIEEATGH